MSDRIEIEGLQVDAALAGFVNARALPGTGVDKGAFWSALSALIHDFGPRNRALLETREAMQARIDQWHRDNRDFDAAAYEAFLKEIGYLVDEGPDFEVDSANVDPEIAVTPGPQLVVPVMNARYALNAANARWGSLYDALYGTDAMGDAPTGGGYSDERGARVIAWAKAFLDETFPLTGASHADVT
ncbi:MAG: malate synthase G, partial [Pseudomonadota bacterium]